jgi:hypothetical protein
MRRGQEEIEQVFAGQQQPAGLMDSFKDGGGGGGEELCLGRELRADAGRFRVARSNTRIV